MDIVYPNGYVQGPISMEEFGRAQRGYGSYVQVYDFDGSERFVAGMIDFVGPRNEVGIQEVRSGTENYLAKQGHSKTIRAKGDVVPAYNNLTRTVDDCEILFVEMDGTVNCEFDSGYRQKYPLSEARRRPPLKSGIMECEILYARRGERQV